MPRIVITNPIVATSVETALTTKSCCKAWEVIAAPAPVATAEATAPEMPLGSKTRPVIRKIFLMSQRHWKNASHPEIGVHDCRI
ncbi:hypothetical protein E6H31_05345 [Candidatus Bathyarchaeota archaeon]|nr:MAG: hypothetical protein E6H31_05345 [Candidatus Bathyarchaeota archaeon]